MGEKKCSSCKKSKLLCEFNKDKSRKDNLYPLCKACRNAQQKQYRLDNKDKICAWEKQHYLDNKDKILAQQKQRYNSMKSAIYQIKNIKNNKIYIGCSTRLERRWLEHKRLLKKGRHENSFLQKDYNKYGKDVFVYSILKEHQKDIQFQDLEKEETKLILEKKQNGEKLYNISVKISSL